MPDLSLSKKAAPHYLIIPSFGLDGKEIWEEYLVANLTFTMNTEEVLQKLSRRWFLRNSVIAATEVILLPSGLVGCKKDPHEGIRYKRQGFNEGVASFDPEQDRVILWTRYTPAGQEADQPTILLDVAKGQGF